MQNAIAIQLIETKYRLKLILKKSGKHGIAQGGPLSPLLSNLYLTEVDEMLERAKSYSHRRDGYYHVEYARFADDLVVLIDGHRIWEDLPQMIIKRLEEEFARLGVTMNREKTKMVNLTNYTDRICNQDLGTNGSLYRLC